MFKLLNHWCNLWMIKNGLFFILFLATISLYHFLTFTHDDGSFQVTKVTQYPSFLLSSDYFEQRSLFADGELKYDKRIQNLERSQFIYDKQ